MSKYPRISTNKNLTSVHQLPATDSLEKASNIMKFFVSFYDIPNYIFHFELIFNPPL